MDELIVTTHKAKPGLTSVIISHDIRAVMHIADKMVMLYEGVVYDEGTPEHFETSDDALIKQFIAGSLIGPMSV